MPRLGFAGNQPYPCAGDCCEPVEPGACECTCSLCSDTAPCCWKIVISGVVAKDPEVCADCGTLNGTHYARQDPDNTCVWECLKSGNIDCEDSRDVTLTLYLDGSDYKIKVELGDHTWIKDYGTSKPDCCAIVNDELTFSASGSDCDSSSATCIITRKTGTSCPCTHNCAECDAADDWVVDLDVGGWTDVACDACTELVGEFTMFWSGGSACYWFYEDTEFCTGGGAGLILNLFLTGTSPNWIYEFEVWVERFGGQISHAFYRLEFVDADCMAPFAGGAKATFTQYSEGHSGGPSPCEGTMPETLELWPAP